VYLSCVLFGVFVSFLRFFESRLDKSLRLFVLIRSLEKNLSGFSYLNSFLLYFCLLRPFR
jgi:hypothetical protein